MKPRPPRRSGPTPRPRRSAASRSSPVDGLGGEQVEGRQAVRELLRARRRKVHQVLVADGVDEAGALGEIIDLATEARVLVRKVGRDQLAAAALTDSPQGVLARADPISDTDLYALATRSLDNRPPFLLVLDGVTDPHNLGAVMRSGLCAGVTGVVVGRHRAARLTPSAVKAAAGAVEHLPIATVPGIPAALATLAEAGIWTVALASGAPTDLWDLRVATEPVALVLGAEGRGLSRLVRQRCDVAVAIPLLGPLDSLNVSAAAALACFEVARRRESASRP
jgi:23S rRNA (guanosine2251-2'-O)-methyltransferase